MLVLQYGPREAARMCGLAENTVLSWTHRGKWLEDTKVKAAKLPPPASMRAINAIKSPVDALMDVLREDGDATKVAAMRYARRTTEHAASLAETSPEQALAQAADVKAVVQTAALAGGWAGATGSQLHVNILSTGVIEF